MGIYTWNVLWWHNVMPTCRMYECRPSPPPPPPPNPHPPKSATVYVRIEAGSKMTGTK